jgi:hypothetical protein
MTESTSFSGGCLCGAVAFEVDHAEGPFEHCHCSRCRKVSGGTGMPTIAVRRDALRFVRGRTLVASFEAPVLREPPPFRSTFCRVCGSPVPDPEPRGPLVEIPAGLVEGDPGVRLDKHIYVDLAAPWETIPDDAPRFTAHEIHAHRSATGPERPS